MDFTVEFYETVAGACPVRDFLDTLKKSDPDDFAAVVAGLAKLRSRQYHREPLCKSLGDGLFETDNERIRHQPVAGLASEYDKGRTHYVKITCGLPQGSSFTSRGQVEYSCPLVFRKESPHRRCARHP